MLSSAAEASFREGDVRTVVLNEDVELKTQSPVTHWGTIIYETRVILLLSQMTMTTIP